MGSGGVGVKSQGKLKVKVKCDLLAVHVPLQTQGGTGGGPREMPGYITADGLTVCFIFLLIWCILALHCLIFFFNSPHQIFLSCNQKKEVGGKKEHHRPFRIHRLLRGSWGPSRFFMSKPHIISLHETEWGFGVSKWSIMTSLMETSVTVMHYRRREFKLNEYVRSAVIQRFE